MVSSVKPTIQRQGSSSHPFFASMCDSFTCSTSALWLLKSPIPHSAQRQDQLVGVGAQSGSSFTELSGVSGWLLLVASDP
jgi:hypothetical protein